MSSNDKKAVSMKLTIDKKANRVLYAEAGKDCVDFLFHLFVLPVGAAMKYLLKDDHDDGAVGSSLGNLYKSVKGFPADLLQNAAATRETLLTLRAAAPAATDVPLWLAGDLGTTPIWPNPRIVYSCCIDDVKSINRHTMSDYRYCDVSDRTGGSCRFCYNSLNTPWKLTYIAHPEDKTRAGYVKAHVPYMVTDDLVVKPLSSNSLITLFADLRLKDTACVEVTEVTLDLDQGLALLKASMKSKTVLTDTFLRNKE